VAKWKVEFSGDLIVEAESEAEAIECALEKLAEDPNNVLFADAEIDDDDEEDER
jgi:hypothetical protein